ncbi:MAG: phosphotransferase, partial [Prevotellaceae bacterium]|nr:phosphotransferase [Prevotellaceae bacterium]
MSENKIIELYEKYTKSSVSNIYALQQSGSNRQYFKISSDGGNVVGVVGTSVAENIAFIKIAQQFEKQGINAPRVLTVSDDKLCYLQTDLGDTILFDEITKEQGTKSKEQGQVQGNITKSPNHQITNLLHKTISYLPDIQFKTAQNFDFLVCFPQAEFDRRNIFFDLNYFKYCFLKNSGIEFDEIALENDFEKLSNLLLNCHSRAGGNPTQFTDEQEIPACAEITPSVFMYRDFQSRNVMLKDGEPYFIDFQGGRKGAIYYDVASFLWQAKANFSDELRNELIDTYLEKLQKYHTISKDDFLEKLRYFVLFRQLQVLGAYGFRGLFEQKQHFLDSIPFALENIKKLLPFEELPYLSALFSTQMTQIKQINTDNNKICENQWKSVDRLTVQIESFSYKKGIPKDTSGNGGGYVFDCRSIYNPGRFDEYKNLTGL